MGFADKILNKLAKNFAQTEIIKQGKKIYNFKKLNDRANQIAWAMMDLGIEKGEKLGILLFNSPEYLEIMYGLQKIGIIPVPINYRYGSMEYKYIYENSDVIGIFIDKSFVEPTRNLLVTGEFEKIKYIFVVNAPKEEIYEGMINYEKFIENKKTENPEVEVKDDEIALILYTGGTTGYPKGALLTHGNMYNATYMTPKHGMKMIQMKKLRENALMPPAGKKMKFLIPTPIFHVSGLMPVITQVGLRNLMVFPESTSFDPEEICRIIQDDEITSLFMVPTMYKLLLNYPDLDRFDLSSLTLISSGGGKLPQYMKLELLKKFNWTTLVDGYGSTETIGTSTIAFMVHDDIPKIKKGYVGQPVTGMKIRCINEKGEDLPRGEIGEMVFKGDTIMKGYYKDDSKTKSTLDHEGWLFSGDLCYIDEEDNVYYVGRKEEMITSGGEKIYPVEIEDVLRLYEKVEDIAIIGIPDEIWGEKVVAFVKPKPNVDLTKEEIIQYITGKIASYKKPRIIKFVKELPLTKTGKLNRIELGEWAENLAKES